MVAIMRNSMLAILEARVSFLFIPLFIPHRLLTEQHLNQMSQHHHLTLLCSILLCLLIVCRADPAAASSPPLQLLSLSSTTAVLHPPFDPIISEYNQTVGSAWGAIMNLFASIPDYSIDSPLVLEYRTAGWTSFPWVTFPSTGGIMWSGGPGTDLRIMNNVTGEYRIVTVLQQFIPITIPNDPASDATISSIVCQSNFTSMVPQLAPSFDRLITSYQLLLNIEPTGSYTYECTIRVSNPLGRVAISSNWNPIQLTQSSNGIFRYNNTYGVQIIVWSTDGTQASQYFITAHAQGRIPAKDTELRYMWAGGGQLLPDFDPLITSYLSPIALGPYNSYFQSIILMSVNLYSSITVAQLRNGEIVPPPCCSPQATNATYQISYGMFTHLNDQFAVSVTSADGTMQRNYTITFFDYELNAFLQDLQQFTVITSDSILLADVSNDESSSSASSSLSPSSSPITFELMPPFSPFITVYTILVSGGNTTTTTTNNQSQSGSGSVHMSTFKAEFAFVFAFGSSWGLQNVSFAVMNSSSNITTTTTTTPTTTTTTSDSSDITTVTDGSTESAWHWQPCVFSSSYTWVTPNISATIGETIFFQTQSVHNSTLYSFNIVTSLTPTPTPVDPINPSIDPNCGSCAFYAESRVESDSHSSSSSDLLSSCHCVIVVWRVIVIVIVSLLLLILLIVILHRYCRRSKLPSHRSTNTHHHHSSDVMVLIQNDQSSYGQIYDQY